ncbi:hypothetical protein FQA39_LY14982 [Lamprigera yunnana]|nr:hypothetical protein FQA39_LY14982 [Lamprigera yunnana]
MRYHALPNMRYCRILGNHAPYCEILTFEAYTRAATMEDSINAFLKTGLVPCNRNIFRDYDFSIHNDAANGDRPTTCEHPHLGTSDRPETSGGSTNQKLISGDVEFLRYKQPINLRSRTGTVAIICWPIQGSWSIGIATELLIVYTKDTASNLDNVKRKITFCMYKKPKGVYVGLILSSNYAICPPECYENVREEFWPELNASEEIKRMSLCWRCEWKNGRTHKESARKTWQQQSSQNWDKLIIKADTNLRKMTDPQIERNKDEKKGRTFNQRSPCGNSHEELREKLEKIRYQNRKYPKNKKINNKAKTNETKKAMEKLFDANVDLSSNGYGPKWIVAVLKSPEPCDSLKKEVILILSF